MGLSLKHLRWQQMVSKPICSTLSYFAKIDHTGGIAIFDFQNVDPRHFGFSKLQNFNGLFAVMTAAILKNR